MVKIAVGLGVVILLCLFALNILVERNSVLRDQLTAQSAQLKAQIEVRVKEQADALAASLRSAHYQQQRVQSDEEIRRLEQCIADKSCVPRVRVYTTCPTLPGAPADTAGATVTHAELGEDSRRLVLQLKRDIKLTRDRYQWLQDELRARGP